MSEKAYLVLENGAVFEGKSFGASGEVVGEVVFTTGMTGYLETLTDPSYHGQIVLQTFPLIGNYGVIPSDFESKTVGASAYIVKHRCQHPSNFRSEGELDTFLKDNNIVGLYDIDTRALTRMIRNSGVMNGAITHKNPSEIPKEVIKNYIVKQAVKEVAVQKSETFEAENSIYNVALLDFGYKKNIVGELTRRGCRVFVMPSNTTAKELNALELDGIMLSNGPGDPAENVEVISNLKEIVETKIPVFGICLGHQLLALAMGFKTEKLRFGHRGANQPVKDLTTGRVFISSQNHGYAVCSKSIRSEMAREWFVNVNDNTCEGIIYNDIPARTVQFHPEACGGPQDTGFLFDDFIKSLEVK